MISSHQLLSCHFSQQVFFFRFLLDQEVFINILSTIFWFSSLVFHWFQRFFINQSCIILNFAIELEGFLPILETRFYLFIERIFSPTYHFIIVISHQLNLISNTLSITCLAELVFQSRDNYYYITHNQITRYCTQFYYQIMTPLL